MQKILGEIVTIHNYDRIYNVQAQAPVNNSKNEKIDEI
jgi:hypothetical protein